MAKRPGSPRPPELTAISAVLAARIGAPIPSGTADLDWAHLEPSAVLAAAVRHRVTGLVATSPDTLGLPASALALLRHGHRLATMRVMRQATDLVDLLERFRSADIPVLVIKGQPFAALAYGDWTVRGLAADTDLLISPSAISAAHNAMVADGYRCAHDEGRVSPITGPVGRYNQWLHYERHYVGTAETSVDVHWRPVPGSAPWTRFENLWRERASVIVHGSEVQTPGPAGTMRIVAAQGETDGWPTLRAAVDVLAATRLLTAESLSALAANDRLVAAAVAHAHDYLHAGNRQWWDPQTIQPMEQWRREWILRTRTGSLFSALARSALGKALPARRLRPMDPSAPNH